MVIILDSSYLIALYNEADVHHKKAIDLWSKIKINENSYFISDHIFDEIIAVTLRKAGKEKANNIGQHLIESINIINVTSQIFQETWRIFKETKSNSSFTDCTNLALLKLIGSNKIATFDKSFKEINKWVEYLKIVIVKQKFITKTIYHKQCRI